MSNARLSDAQPGKPDLFLFSLFPLGVWLVAGLVVYFLAPRIARPVLRRGAQDDIPEEEGG